MREPTATGGSVSHSTDLMLRYQAVALSGSAAKAATSWRGRAISISVTTSTATALPTLAPRNLVDRLIDVLAFPFVDRLIDEIGRGVSDARWGGGVGGGVVRGDGARGAGARGAALRVRHLPGRRAPARRRLGLLVGRERPRHDVGPALHARGGLHDLRRRRRHRIELPALPAPGAVQGAGGGHD